MTTHQTYTIPCGIVLIAIGLLVRYHISRRRFNRRGIGGLQHYSSYRRAMVTSVLETVVMFTGTFLIIAGVRLLAVAYIIHHKF